MMNCSKVVKSASIICIYIYAHENAIKKFNFQLNCKVQVQCIVLHIYYVYLNFFDTHTQYTHKINYTMLYYINTNPYVLNKIKKLI